MNVTSKRLALVAACAAPLLAAWSATPHDIPARTRAVTLQFDAVVGNAPFRCGETYQIGGREVSGRDMRFYVSRISLLRADGTAVPMSLDAAAPWQLAEVALLDFEDGTAGCRNGTPDMRTVVTGTVPEGDYIGVRFDVGVPFELNHINQATAPSPLSLTALFWSWNAGYKFMRAEVLSDQLPQGFFIHLGSTECSPSGRSTQPATECRNGNRPTIELTGFDVATDRILFDLAAVLAGTDLSGDEDRTRAACMSAPADANCAPIFRSLGLAFGGQAAQAQTAFRVGR